MAEKINDKFLKPYDSSDTEERVYKTWEESGYFNPDNLPERHKEPFSIILPPPNVTGTLHLGHAFEDTIQDIVVRYKRMKGYKTLWVPGTDHASIATQSKVEKELIKEEGKNRHDLGREEFLKRVEKFARESRDTIVNQVRRMGASLDWSREAFTLDEKRNLSVRTAFKKMYDAGLIYRGSRVVNWDPKGQTTISDDEIVYETRKAKLYTFKYSKDIPISISTTRPETKLGDTAIAVHPEDERYKKYIGKEYDAVFAGENIHLKIIADEKVEMEFGTGALGVTPAHSMTDFEIGERHGLLVKQVINEYAKMTVGMDGVKDKKTTEAREAIVSWLKSEGLLEKEEEFEQNISTAERTGGIVEPLPKLQWFIDVNKEFKNKKNEKTTLKKIMREAVAEDGINVAQNRINIVPDRFLKVYLNWIDNLRDWCISRQLWYGHRIPVWYKNDEIYCDIDAPGGSEEMAKKEGYTQDSDTLDTWFSSGLWTFSTLGWPEETKDLKTFHPTTFMAPGYEIIFFWVARMILMSGFLLEEIPFKTVYLHGIVRDSKGQKFSKSMKNGIDPLDMINKYGTDALRMSLVVAVGPGNDTKFDEQKVKAYRSFANKLWNISRFIFSSVNSEYDESFERFSIVDKNEIEKKKNFISEITKEMDEYKFYLVSEKIYHFVWHDFADRIIEESKKILREGSEEEKASRLQFLLQSLQDILHILHPFMPYVTEEIWSHFPKKDKKLLFVDEWPV